VGSGSPWTVASSELCRAIDTARERFQLQRYLDSMEKADQEATLALDPTAVEAALKKLRDHPEPEVGSMLMRQNTLPAYNVQSAVDTEHALIVAHDVVLDAADNRCLQPMAEAARAALGKKTFNVVADAGYSNGEQAANCEAAGMMPHVPATRTVNPKGNGTLFQRTDFSYQPETDTYLCPAAKPLRRKAIRVAEKRIDYIANESDCGACSLKQ
jgi:hypothetical protein